MRPAEHRVAHRAADQVQLVAGVGEAARRGRRAAGASRSSSAPTRRCTSTMFEQAAVGRGGRRGHAPEFTDPARRPDTLVPWSGPRDTRAPSWPSWRPSPRARGADGERRSGRCGADRRPAPHSPATARPRTRRRRRPAGGAHHDDDAGSTARRRPDRDHRHRHQPHRRDLAVDQPLRARSGDVPASRCAARSELRAATATPSTRWSATAEHRWPAVRRGRRSSLPGRRPSYTIRVPRLGPRGRPRPASTGSACTHSAPATARPATSPPTVAPAPSCPTCPTGSPTTRCRSRWWCR